MDAVVLLSGGLDSAANLALAHQQGWKCRALTVNYGQQAWESEQKAAQLRNSPPRVGFAICGRAGWKRVDGL